MNRSGINNSNEINRENRIFYLNFTHTLNGNLGSDVRVILNLTFDSSFLSLSLILRLYGNRDSCCDQIKSKLFFFLLFGKKMKIFKGFEIDTKRL